MHIKTKLPQLSRIKIKALQLSHIKNSLLWLKIKEGPTQKWIYIKAKVTQLNSTPQLVQTVKNQFAVLSTFSQRKHFEFSLLHTCEVACQR